MVAVDRSIWPKLLGRLNRDGEFGQVAEMISQG
jgi:hypothetical protein